MLPEILPQESQIRWTSETNNRLPTVAALNKRLIRSRVFADTGLLFKHGYNMQITTSLNRFLWAAFSLLILLGSCKSEKSSEESVVPASDYVPTPDVKESIARGATIYNNFCAQCHLSGGEGIPETFPPVNKADWLYDKREESIRAIKYGLSGPIEVNGKPYNNLMPNLYLEDQEVVDVMNYMLTAWDNQMTRPVDLEEVQAISP